MVALYRLVELNSGSIILDDVDISTLGLADLRSKIASKFTFYVMRPQIPMLSFFVYSSFA